MQSPNACVTPLDLWDAAHGFAYFILPQLLRFIKFQDKLATVYQNVSPPFHLTFSSHYIIWGQMDNFAAHFIILPFFFSFRSLCATSSKQSLDISLEVHCRQAYVPVSLFVSFFKLLARKTWWTPGLFVTIISYRPVVEATNHTLIHLVLATHTVS